MSGEFQVLLLKNAEVGNGAKKSLPRRIRSTSLPLLSTIKQQSPYFIGECNIEGISCCVPIGGHVLDLT